MVDQLNLPAFQTAPHLYCAWSWIRGFTFQPMSSWHCWELFDVLLVLWKSKVIFLQGLDCCLLLLFWCCWVFHSVFFRFSSLNHFINSLRISCNVSWLYLPWKFLNLPSPPSTTQRLWIFFPPPVWAVESNLCCPTTLGNGACPRVWWSYEGSYHSGKLTSSPPAAIKW